MTSKLSVMLFLSVFAAIIWGCCGVNLEDEITFKRVDPLSKIFRESNFLPQFSDTVDMAAGETATFQFAVRSGKSLKGLNISISDFKSNDGVVLNQESTLGFIDFVRVGRITPSQAPDAIIPQSRYFPDPIIEKQDWDVERDITQPMWASVKVDEDSRAGVYDAIFTLEGKVGGKKFKTQKSVTIRVYPVVLEEPSLWVANWFWVTDDHMRKMNNGNPVERYSEQYWSQVKELAEIMKICYQNSIFINPVEHIKFDIDSNGKYKFDYTNFDKIVNIFKEAGVLKMLEGGHIAYRETHWSSPFAVNVPIKKDGEIVMEKFRIEHDNAKNFLTQFIPALTMHLKDNGLGEVYAQHIADEPIGSNIDSYVAIAKMVKSLSPDIKIIEACHTSDLADVVDIWVPQLDYYQGDYDFYLKRQEAGDQVWFYTCLSPQGNYVNRFLDQPLIKTRLIHWLNYRYGATGYLHWGLNYWWSEDPYRETTSMSEESGNTLPGGDSWIVYPDNGKLYGSIRLEAMRDGIADYTLLQMLEKKDPALAKELCRLTVFNWGLYDIDGDSFRARRKKILETLSN